MGDSSIERYVNSTLFNKKQILIGCFHAETLVGLLHYGFDNDCAEIAITVDKAWRRMGIASLLVKAAILRAKGHCYSEVGCSFLPENTDMRTLLNRSGFELKSTHGFVSGKLAFAQAQEYATLFDSPG